MMYTDLQAKADAWYETLSKHKGSLADKLRMTSLLNADQSEACVSALNLGRQEGIKLMKRFEGRAFHHDKYFQHGSPESKKYEFRRSAEAFKETLPSFFKQPKNGAKHTEGDHAQDEASFNAQIAEGCAGMLDQMALKARKEYADMLANPERYRHLTHLDHETMDLTRAASFLLAALQEGLYTANEAQEAALQFGLMSGAAREAVCQAVDAFDHAQHTNHYNDQTDYLFYLVLQIGVVVGALVLCGWFLPLVEKLAFEYLASTLCSLFVFSSVTTVTIGVLCIPVMMLLEHYSAQRMAAARITKEGHARVQSVFHSMVDTHESETDVHPLLQHENSGDEHLIVYA